jgi:hypothetical protein
VRAIDRLVDTAPLRSSPAFRRLWAASSLSQFGGQLTTVAVLYHVWELTRSPLWVGMVGLAQAVVVELLVEGVFGRLGPVLRLELVARNLVEPEALVPAGVVDGPRALAVALLRRSRVQGQMPVLAAELHGDEPVLHVGGRGGHGRLQDAGVVLDQPERVVEELAHWRL